MNANVTTPKAKHTYLLYFVCVYFACVDSVASVIVWRHRCDIMNAAGFENHGQMFNGHYFAQCTAHSAQFMDAPPHTHTPIVMNNVYVEWKTTRSNLEAPQRWSAIATITPLHHALASQMKFWLFQTPNTSSKWFSIIWIFGCFVGCMLYSCEKIGKLIFH